MDVVFYIFDITPFVIISSIIAIIVAIFIKNEKAKKILATTGIIVLFGYTIFLMSIAIPNMFLSALFENGDGIIAMISIIIAVWAIVSLFIYLKNRYIIRKNNIKEIYIILLMILRLTGQEAMTACDRPAGEIPLEKRQEVGII